MVKIVVDSSCDLPDKLIEEYDIKVLPQRIYLRDMEYYDKVTIQAEEVYEAMNNGIIPMTSLPSPAAILDLFYQCCREGNDFIFVSISSKFSGTYHLAASLLEEVREQYKESRMEVVDSKSASTAAGLIALQAAKLSRAGKDFDVILKQICEMAEHVEHIFMVADLSWLIRGGRITRTEGVVGSMLNVLPVLHVKDGAVEQLERVRGRKKALLTILKVMEDRIGDFPDQTIGISHGGNLEMAYELKDMIKQRFGNDKIMINKIGAVLISHLGIGGVGIFFFNRKPDMYME
ncbi:MAG TPA: DegV family protein [Clostridia bacterium]|nr:DegV family protein [Clostridia bacterium]